jgi:predicted MPP superfamily phosphohydrolase
VPGRRRQALAALALWPLLAIIGLRSGYSAGQPAPAEVAVEVPLERLPACLDGYRVGMISDVHGGPLAGRAEVARLADWAAAARLDVLLLDGDFADGKPDRVGGVVTPLADLAAGPRAPPDGVFFVTGNHEYLHGGSGQAWMDWWRARGVRVLYNSRAMLPADGRRGCAPAEALALLGVPDFWMDMPDLPAALDQLDPAAATVLLAHQPKQIVEAATLGVGLQLSGHVHGGQTWPLHAGVWLANPYFSGLARHPRGSWIYVSEGAVGWGERVRLLSTPEVTVVTLRTPAAFAAAGRPAATGVRQSEAAALAAIAIAAGYSCRLLLLLWRRRYPHPPAAPTEHLVLMSEGS